MAQTISIGLSTYLEDFAGGQVGLRTGDYTQYATDLDTNFNTLRVTINQIIAELNAVQGPNAGLGVDILIFDRDGRGGGTLSTGVVGIESFESTINAGDVEVNPGTCLINGVVVRNAVGALFDVAAFPDGTGYIAIDNNGTLYAEQSASQRDLDIYSFTVTSGVASAPVLLADIFFDGDEYERLRDRNALTNSWAAKDFTQAYLRLSAIERFLGGQSTDDDGDALPSRLLLQDGSAATPGIGFVSGINTGFFQQTSGVIGVTVSGSEVMRFRSTGLRVVPQGSAGTPSISRTGDTNTGWFFPAADEMAASTAGNEALRIDPQGNIDLALNSRVKGRRDAFQDFVDATQTNIAFTAADDFDLGNWHNHSGGSPGDEEFTVPTGDGGTYIVTVEHDWESGVDATNDISVYLMLNGTTVGTHDVARQQKQVVSGEEYADAFSAVLVLAAADVLRVAVVVDTSAGSNMGIDNARISIVKVA